MAEEIAWLVEFPAQGGSGIEGCPGIERASWWMGADKASATVDSLLAVRFSRREDAERVIASHEYLRSRGAVATEHVWMDHADPADTSRADKVRMDWLEDEEHREDQWRDAGFPNRGPRSLFRENLPITRERIDEAMEGRP